MNSILRSNEPLQHNINNSDIHKHNNINNNNNSNNNNNNNSNNNDSNNNSYCIVYILDIYICVKKLCQ